MNYRLAVPRRGGAGGPSPWQGINCLYLLIIPILVVAGQGFAPAQTSACADHSISAGAVRTPEEVEAFVKCAYEFVQEVGFEEARRAFHEDERWRKGASYILGIIYENSKKVLTPVELSCNIVL